MMATEAIDKKAQRSPLRGSTDKKHLYRAGSHSGAWEDLPTDADELDSLINTARRQIESWLSAVFQAEHFNLLLGSGFTTAVAHVAGVGATGMSNVTFGTTYDTAIDAHAQAGATAMKRGEANIEDQFRSALALLDGLGVMDKVPPAQEPEEL